MKLISLEFQAFGSYKGKEKIDFTKLNKAFLITGPTGAGKSTIFDALTYAFYGKASSASGKNEGNMRCKSADNRTPTEVKVVFEKDGKIYTIIRRPEQELFTYKGKGSRAKNKELKETIGNGDKSLDLFGPDICPEKDKQDAINDLIKLDVEQWRHVVMLAQGEFKTLITAKTDVRTAILQSIFNTKMYGDVSKVLKKDLEDLEKKKAEQGTKFNTRLESIEYLEGSEHGSKLKEMIVGDTAITQFNKVFELIDSIIKEDKALLSESDAAIEEIEKKKLEIEKNYKDALDCSSLYSDLDKKNGLLEDLNEKEEEIKGIERDCEFVDKALKNVRPKKLLLDDNRARYDSLTNALEDERNKKIILQESKEKADLVLNEAVVADAAEQGLRDSAAQIVGKLPKYEQMTALSKEIEDLSEKRDVSAKRKDSLEKTSVELELRKKQLETFIKDNESNGTDLLRIQNELQILKDRLDKMSVLKTETTEYFKDLEQLECLRKISEASEEAKNEAEVRRDEAFDLYDRNKKWLLASELEEGKPCPVCGSTHHPHKAEKSENNMTLELYQKSENSLKKAVKKFEDDRKEYDILNNKLIGKRSMMTQMMSDLSIDAELDGSFSDKLSEIISSEEQKKVVAIQNETKYKGISETIESYRKEHDRILTKIEKNDADLTSCKEELNHLESDLNSKDTLLKSIGNELSFETEDEARSEMDRLIAEADRLKNAVIDAKKECENIDGNIRSIEGSIKSNERSLADVQVSLKSSEKEFFEVLSSNGFQSVEEYDHFAEMEKDLASLKQTVKEYRDGVNSITAQIAQIKEKIGDRTRPEDIDAQKKLLDETSTNYVAEVTNRSETERRIKCNIELVNELIEDSVSYDEIEKRTKMVDKLCDLANGTVKGSAKYTFEQFILETYFSLVLEDASVRLNKMMSRYSFKTHEKSTSSDRAFKIDIYDADEGGYRDVNTLSGGESFLASLALALGLSDIIQKKAGGRTVEALFIDEGFGTLGKELAATAVRSLNELSNGQRPIGVITHIDELIPLVGARLDVSYTKDGGSKINLITE